MNLSFLFKPAYGAAILLLLVAGQPSRGQTPALGLREALETALRNNRALLSDSMNLRITEEKNRQVEASYRPQASYSGALEYNPAIPSQMLPGSLGGQPDKELIPVTFGTRYNFRTGVEITQTLLRKDLRIQIKAAGLQSSIAQTKYQLSKEELIYQVATLYYALQTNAETIRSTQADYLNMKDVRDIARAQVEEGVLKKIDYETIRINVLNLESQLNALQTNYDQQLAYLNFLLGLPADAPTQISSDISRNLDHPGTGDFLQQREDLLLSKQLIEAKEVELKSIRAERLPSLNSYFRYNYLSQSNDAGKSFRSDYISKSSTLGLSVSIPILDGNRRRSRIQTAGIELEQLRLKSDYQQERARMEIVSSSSALHRHLEDYRITQSNYEMATVIFNSRKAMYKEGVSNLMELLDAERELTDARNLHMQALINVQTSRLDVFKANGSLCTAFLQSL